MRPIVRWKLGFHGWNWKTLQRFLRAELLRFGGYEPIVLLAALCIAGATWGFIELADAVREGETQRIDERLLQILRRPDNPGEPIGPPWLQEVGRDISALGSLAVLGLAMLAVVGFLWLDGKLAALTFLMVATGSGLILMGALKAQFGRPRPTIVPHLTDVYTSSFPSGHSMLSAVVYLTFGALLAALVHPRPLKCYCLSVALVLSGLVGISRVYLGVHYPTDVLAGWAAGAGWATLCWLVARQLQRRGRIETGI
jgi:undecaprenyl-diphosphatase